MILAIYVMLVFIVIMKPLERMAVAILLGRITQMKVPAAMVGTQFIWIYQEDFENLVMDQFFHKIKTMKESIIKNMI